MNRVLIDEHLHLVMQRPPEHWGIAWLALHRAVSYWKGSGNFRRYACVVIRGAIAVEAMKESGMYRTREGGKHGKTVWRKREVSLLSTVERHARSAI